MPFLIETRKVAREMERLRVRWGCDCCFTVDSRGHGGGLAVLWNSEFDINIDSYSSNHVDMRVGDVNGD